MWSGPVGLGAIRTRIALSMRPMLAAAPNLAPTSGRLPYADASRSRHGAEMFLTGTILNVVTVLIGTAIGVAVGNRMPARIQGTLTDGLGLFVLVLGVTLGSLALVDPAALPGDELAVLAAVLLGGAIGEALRLP